MVAGLHPLRALHREHALHGHHHPRLRLDEASQARAQARSSFWFARKADGESTRPNGCGCLVFSGNPLLVVKAEAKLTEGD